MDISLHKPNFTFENRNTQNRLKILVKLVYFQVQNVGTTRLKILEMLLSAVREEHVVFLCKIHRRAAKVTDTKMKVQN